MNVQGKWGVAVVMTISAPFVLAESEVPAVTPYRPSVSTPAALSAPGWLELEMGVQANRRDRHERRNSLPYTLKLAFSPDWGVRLGGEALVHLSDGAGATTWGGGDASVVLKRRLAIDDERAFGLELGANAATAGSGLGSGHSSLMFNGIYSADFARGLHSDLNLGATRRTGAGAGEGRITTAGAASVSGTINSQWGWVAEVSGTHQKAAGTTAQGLAALSCGISPSTSFDFGLARSLRAGVPDLSVFAGMTVLLAKLF